MAQWDDSGRAPDGTYPSQLSGENAKMEAAYVLEREAENERVLGFVRSRLRQRATGEHLYDKTARSFLREFDALVQAER
jgi:hypothetical protein